MKQKILKSWISLRGVPMINHLFKLFFFLVHKIVLYRSKNFIEPATIVGEDNINIHIFMLHIAQKLEGHRRKDSSRPNGFSYARCFNSLVKPIEKDKSVCLTIVYDGSSDDWERDSLREIYDNLSLAKNLIINDVGSSWENYVLAIDQALTSSSCNYIYLLENDYLHSQTWLSQIKHLISSGGDIFAVFNHPDYADPTKFACKSSFRSSALAKSFWTATCTGTFIISKSLLKKKRLTFEAGGKDYNTFPILAAQGFFVKAPCKSVALHGEESQLDVSAWNLFEVTDNS